jgi:hypothetical protein
LCFGACDSDLREVASQWQGLILASVSPCVDGERIPHGIVDSINLVPTPVVGENPSCVIVDNESHSSHK